MKYDQIRPYFNEPNKDGNRDERIWGKIKRNIEALLSEYEHKRTGKSLPHDEPLITLVSLYGLFGDQSDLDSRNRLSAVNKLFSDVLNRRKTPAEVQDFTALTGAFVEVYLHENKKFRKFLRDTIFKEAAHHPYSDRRIALAGKRKKENASFEGNTNLDALISGKLSSGKPAHIFIEAKFLSDISTEITYLPVRNQIARNIDCALDLMTNGGKNLEEIDNFWFFLLTPGMFRTREYGGPTNHTFKEVNPTYSRFYCYKMNEYLDPGKLKEDLPHWTELNEEHWVKLSKRIGWLTFEEIASAVETNNLLQGDEMTEFKKFLSDRELS
jgi:hypothetical protein